MKKQIKNKLFDKEFRQKIIANPNAYARELNSLPDDVNIIVKTNTVDTTYIVFSDNKISGDDFGNINAAVGLSTVGTTGSGSTIGTVSGTASTFLSIGSVGSVGSIEGK